MYFFNQGTPKNSDFLTSLFFVNSLQQRNNLSIADHFWDLCYYLVYQDENTLEGTNLSDMEKETDLADYGRKSMESFSSKEGIPIYITMTHVKSAFVLSSWGHFELKY